MVGGCLSLCVFLKEVAQKRDQKDIAQLRKAFSSVHDHLWNKNGLWLYSNSDYPSLVFGGKMGRPKWRQLEYYG
jgi:hypothetical protein